MKTQILIAVSILMLASCNNKNEQVAEEKGDCPFGFDDGHKKEQVSLSKSTQDW